jgi:hypothetical protein
MPTLTRGQKILACTALLIVALFVTGVATQQRTSGEQPDPANNGLVKLLGGWFGGPDQVSPEDLSASCLNGNVLTIEGTCVLTVEPAAVQLREVRLRTDQPLHLKTRAPQGETILENAVEAGAEIKVTVDGEGADITLSCQACSVLVGD